MTLSSRGRLAALLVLGALVLAATFAGVRLLQPASNPEPALPPAWTGLEITEPDHGGVLGLLGDHERAAWTPYRASFVLGGASLHGARRDAAFWTHDAASGWAIVPERDGEFRGAAVVDVTSVGGRLVAIGSAPAAEGHSRTVFWTSDDGATWARQDAPALFDDYGGVIVGGPAGFLTVGEIYDPQGASKRIGRSADGVRWEVVSAETFMGVDVRGVVGFAGGFVIVGVDQDAADLNLSDQPARAWWSADGASWVETTPKGAFGFQGVYAGATGLLVQGYEACAADPTCEQVATWQSADGRGWSRIAGVPRGLGLASDGQRIVSFDRATRSLAWSYDGRSWQPLATLPDGEQLGAMAVGPGGVLFGRVLEGGTFLQHQHDEGWIWYLPAIVAGPAS